MDEKFEEIDHCGDVGIEAWGATVEEAFENVTIGLFSLMTHGGVAPKTERKLSVVATSDEDLLVDWLSEVITAASLHGEVYCEVEIRCRDARSIVGVIRGEPIDPARHELRFDVKAATYHRLLIERAENGYRIRVIFDL